MSRRNYDELLTSATTAMLEKLRENEHKPAFDEVSFKDAFKGLCNEKMELAEELYSNRSLEQIRREAADVANYAAMIILKCDKMIEAGHETPRYYE